VDIALLIVAVTALAVLWKQTHRSLTAAERRRIEQESDEEYDRTGGL
jgi:hypothetical protein